MGNGAAIALEKGLRRNRHPARIVDRKLREPHPLPFPHPAMPRPATLQDVADRARVHRSTVALALRDHPRIPT